MPKNNKLYCTKIYNVFIMQFGFSYPVAGWNTLGRKDTLTKSNGKQRVELNKKPIC
jgi:hypothetical protein